MTEIKPNPLMKHFRQPKLYIDLPSKGLFYPQGTLELTEDGKVAVYAMTAKDEIMIKTPDALLNGPDQDKNWAISTGHLQRIRPPRSLVISSLIRSELGIRGWLKGE